jgi:hypothetical protein
MVKGQAGKRFPRRGIAIYLFIVGGFLSLAWLGRIIPPLFTGTPPFGLESYTTLVIQAVDLGVIVPVSILTAVLLWKNRPWGYTLATVVVVKGLTMGAALVAMIIGQTLAGISISLVEAIMFTGIALAALIFTILTFRNIKDPVIR